MKRINNKKIKHKISKKFSIKRNVYLFPDPSCLPRKNIIKECKIETKPKNFSMKIWFSLMFLFLGTIWALEPAWNVEASQNPQPLILEAIDCKEVICPSYVEKEKVKQKKYTGVFTAYTALESLTDSSPTITASGETVVEGGIASNDFPFNTRISTNIGTFKVNDRMNRRYNFKKTGRYNLDIYLSTYRQAKEFGVKEMEFYVE